MPTYEYRCKDCGEPLEVVQAFTDDALTECPACGGRLKKVFGNVGIAFKGSGFYKTDSRGSKASAGASADGGSGASGSSDSSSSTDAKPAAGSSSSDAGSSSTPKAEPAKAPAATSS